MDKKVFGFLGTAVLFLLYWHAPMTATATVDAEPEIPAMAAAGECRSAGTSVLPVDQVSSGEELMAWMEAHKSIGGAVCLTEDVVLEELYCFSPDRPGRPPVLVDMRNHSITISGEVDFFSDGNLTFRGQPEAGSFFYVAQGGILSLSGVSVECEQPEDAPQCILWQEEGAGLILDESCRIQGEIHYADLPVVLGRNTVCVIAEKDQTADDVIPAQVDCRVNYQGQVRHHQQVPVLWDLTGTEKQQEERLRFSVQGSFPFMASQMPPVCTVVYNDFPLTFTWVGAYENSNSYLFKGGYTKPEDGLLETVQTEYSFDGEDWFLYHMPFRPDMESFFIGLTFEQWNTEKNPYLYIRLRGDGDGVQYFSNVLRYTADNLDYAVDQGGGRGGGTSIVNPPGVPGTDPGNKNPGSVRPGGEEAPGNTPSDSDRPAGSVPPGGEEVSGNTPSDSGGPAESVPPGGEEVSGNTPSDSGGPAESVPPGGEEVSGNTPSDSGGPAESVPPGGEEISGNIPSDSAGSAGSVPPAGEEASGNIPSDSAGSARNIPPDQDGSAGGKPPENLSEEGEEMAGAKQSPRPVEMLSASSGETGSERGDESVVAVYGDDTDAPTALYRQQEERNAGHGGMLMTASVFAGLSVLAGGVVYRIRFRNK